MAASPFHPSRDDLSLGAAWVVNLALAELVLRRSKARRAPVSLLRVGAP